MDGGASQNDFLMQFQADMLDAEVIRPLVSEATSLGAAYMAGLAVGYWQDADDCFSGQQVDRIFEPQMPARSAPACTPSGKAVQRSMGWTKK